MPDGKGAVTADSPAAKRIPLLVSRLRAAHPDACCALNHEDPLQLLVATILSAQCTDERVNEVTKDLFVAYPDAAAFGAADRDELEAMVRPTGFFRQKARFVQQSCSIIDHNFDGEVPQEMDELTSLPGVARKTANVVLGVAFGKAEGVVVDTHVRRLSNRLGLTKQKDPNKIEQDLMGLLPRDEWIDFSHLLIFHGRRVCNARKPDCPSCTLIDLCPSSSV